MDAQPFSHFPPFSSSPEPLTSDNSEDSSDAFESETSDLSPTVADPVIAHAVADLFPPEPCGSTLSQVRAGCTFHRQGLPVTADKIENDHLSGVLDINRLNLPAGHSCESCADRVSWVQSTPKEYLEAAVVGTPSIAVEGDRASF